MSLENAIAENTAAVNALVKVWQQLFDSAKLLNERVADGTTTPAEIVANTTAKALPKSVAAPEAAAGQATAAKTAAPETTASASTPVAASAEAAAPASTAATPTPIIYDTVSKAITEAVKVDRAKVIATLAEFGVTKGTQLVPEQFAGFLEALAA